MSRQPRAFGALLTRINDIVTLSVICKYVAHLFPCGRGVVGAFGEAAKTYCVIGPIDDDVLFAHITSTHKFDVMQVFAQYVMLIEALLSIDCYWLGD